MRTSQRLRFTLAIVIGLGALATPAIAQSIDFTTGKLRLNVVAVSETTFKISVQGSADAQPIKSIYLDPQRKTPLAGAMTQDDSQCALKTSAGAIKLDRAKNTFSLFDSTGKELMPAVSIASSEEIKGDPWLDLNIGWPTGKSFDVYGCGNGAESLVQHEVKARVDNGVAVEPFYWSPAGFATFVVGQDENDPATCDGKIRDGHATWHIAGKSADLYLILAPKLTDATAALLDLTGRPPVPPRWTFGYLQSRWGWKDRAYIDDALHQFQSRKIPVDAFIFDFEWYTKFPDYEVKPEGVDGFSDFSFNPALFPEPLEQIKQLHEAGVKFVGIRKPRLGNSQTLQMIRNHGWGFQSKSNVDTRGLWFANPDVRTWYAGQIDPLLRAGIDGWWDDEGEFSYTNYNYWNQAERQALDAVNSNKRLWTICRAFQPGLARYGAACWTGDIRASWKDFKKTPTDLLNWSSAGMPMCACDIGGFGGETTPELLTRWMQAGTFFPIMRTHSEIQAKPHFPWLFGDEQEAAMRKAIELRYRLVPMLYSLAHQMHRSGSPIIEPLMNEFPEDEKVKDLSSEWLLGQRLLAAPILEQGGKRSVYLPKDDWFEFTSGAKITGGESTDVDLPLDRAPLYVRAGTILPLGPIVQHTSELPGGPLEVRIYPGRDAEFTLVEDDGESNDYLRGKTRDTHFIWNDMTHKLSWKQTGVYSGKDSFTTVRPVLVGGQDASQDIELKPDGTATLK